MAGKGSKINSEWRSMTTWMTLFVVRSGHHKLHEVGSTCACVGAAGWNAKLRRDDAPAPPPFIPPYWAD